MGKQVGHPVTGVALLTVWGPACSWSPGQGGLLQEGGVPPSVSRSSQLPGGSRRQASRQAGKQTGGQRGGWGAGPGHQEPGSWQGHGLAPGSSHLSHTRLPGLAAGALPDTESLLSVRLPKPDLTLHFRPWGAISPSRSSFVSEGTQFLHQGTEREINGVYLRALLPEKQLSPLSCLSEQRGQPPKSASPKTGWSDQGRRSEAKHRWATCRWRLEKLVCLSAFLPCL